MEKPYYTLNERTLNEFTLRKFDMLPFVILGVTLAQCDTFNFTLLLLSPDGLV